MGLGTLEVHGQRAQYAKQEEATHRLRLRLSVLAKWRKASTSMWPIYTFNVGLTYTHVACYWCLTFYQLTQNITT